MQFANESNIQPLLVVLFGILSICATVAMFIGNSLKETKSRQRLLYLSKRWKSFRATYYSILEHIVSKLQQSGFGNPWSPSSYDWALRIAYWYPISTYLLVWILIGSAPSGVSGVLPDNAPLGSRLLVLISLAASTALYEIASRSTWKKWVAYSLFAVALLGIAAFFSSSEGFFVVFAAVAVASTVSIIRAIRRDNRSEKPFGVAFVFLAGGLSGATISFVLSILNAPSSYTSSMSLVAIIGIIASVFSFFGVIAKKYNHMGKFLVFQWVVFIGAGLFISTFVDASEYSVSFVSLFVMWGILPFINAPFDWISFSITLLLVKNMIKMRGASIVRNTVVDYIAGILLLFLLAATMTAIFAVYFNVATSAGHSSILNLYGIIEQVRSDPAHPKLFWIYLMVSTTLIPTLAHVFAASVSFWTRISTGIWVWVTPKIKAGISDDFLLRSWISGILTAYFFAIVVTSLSIFGLAILITALLAPYVGSAMLTLSDTLAKYLVSLF